MRQKPAHMMSVAQRKMSSQEEINKRLSLPADLKLPDNFVEKLAVSPTLDGPLSRATRRQSLSEIGKGEIHLNVQETYEVAFSLLTLLFILLLGCLAVKASHVGHLLHREGMTIGNCPTHDRILPSLAIMWKVT